MLHFFDICLDLAKAQSQREESSTNRHLKELNSSQREVPTSKSQRWFLRRIGLVEDMWTWKNDSLDSQLLPWKEFNLKIGERMIFRPIFLSQNSWQSWPCLGLQGSLDIGLWRGAPWVPQTVWVQGVIPSGVIWSYRYDYVIYCNIIIMYVYTHMHGNICIHMFPAVRASYAIALESLIGAKVVLVQGPPGVKCCDGGVLLGDLKPLRFRSHFFFGWGIWYRD